VPVQGVDTTGDVIKLVYTSKRNQKYPLKRKMDDNVKVPVTSKPDKLPRTYDRVIWLESNLLIENTGNSYANV
jgi:hypothetical protein